MPDETCRAFDSVSPFDRNKLHRFLVGVDPEPREMSAAEVQALGDPFATLLLARGKMPRSAEAVVDGISAASPRGSSLKERRSFVVGEGSQLASTQQSAGVDRSMRFLVTLGRGPDGPDVFLSTGDPKQASPVEVMAWDREADGFNYYRSTGEAMWMFAGNSRDALRDSTRGKGPFESHRSGALLMKELKTPWINWHSPAANIAETAFATNDHRRKHEWFQAKDPGGALAFEVDAARPAMNRWAKARFDKVRKRGRVTRPQQIMEQILATPTVNLVTTHVESRALSGSDQLDLPATFFIDADGLADTLGLQPPPPFTVSSKIYARCLQKFNVRLEDGRGFAHRPDTHFCYLVPERAFEDQVVLREAIEVGLVSRRLAASLLMVDPWNPIFSARRRALLRHVPAAADISKGKSTFSREMAKAILAAAEVGPSGSPEAEFAERWKTGARFVGEFNKLLKRYYDAVSAKLDSQTGFEPYFKLAADRRHVFANTMPTERIAEFPLLLPKSNISPARRRMRRDGTVVER